MDLAPKNSQPFPDAAKAVSGGGENWVSAVSLPALAVISGRDQHRT